EECIEKNKVSYNGSEYINKKIVVFRKREEKIKSYFRKELVTKEKISVFLNDTSFHEVDLKLDKQKGKLFGKEGELEILRSKSGSNNEFYRVQLLNDSSTYILYRTDFNCIEIENTPQSRRQFLLGNLYSQLSKTKNGEKNSTPFSWKFTKGDKLQVKIYIKELEKGTNQLNDKIIKVVEYAINDAKIDSNNFSVNYTLTLFDQEFGTKEIYADQSLQKINSWLLITKNALIQDSSYSTKLELLVGDSILSNHPFYPSLEISRPSIEAIWTENQSIGKKSFLINHFYNNQFNGVISWLNEFPLIWSSNGDNILSTVQYLKKGTEVAGTEITPTKSSKPHFSEIIFTETNFSVSTELASLSSAQLVLKDMNGNLVRSELINKKNNSKVSFDRSEIEVGMSYNLVLQNQSDSSVYQTYPISIQ
ncbi:MAG: hypothetical protein RLZZ543_260, partial [Bacteroidota bacterium]